MMHVWLFVEAQGVCRKGIHRVLVGRLKRLQRPSVEVTPMARVGHPPTRQNTRLQAAYMVFMAQARPYIRGMQSQGDMNKIPSNAQNPWQNQRISPICKPSTRKLQHVRI